MSYCSVGLLAFFITTFRKLLLNIDLLGFILLASFWPFFDPSKKIGIVFATSLYFGTKRDFSEK